MVPTAGSHGGVGERSGPCSLERGDQKKRISIRPRNGSGNYALVQLLRVIAEQSFFWTHPELLAGPLQCILDLTGRWIGFGRPARWFTLGAGGRLGGRASSRCDLSGLRLGPHTRHSRLHG